RVDGRPRRRRRGRAVRLRRPRERPRRRRGGARPGAGDRRAAAAAAPAPRRPLLRACPRGARRGRGGEGGACRGAAAPARGRQLVGPCGGEGEPRSARRQRPRRRRRGAVASGPLRARRRARGDRRIGPARGRRRRGGRVNGLLPPSSAVGWVVAVCFLYLLATYAAYGFLLAVSVAERKMRGGSRREGEDERVRSSSLTIPVTIVAPLYNEAPIAVDSVGSFLAVDYPQFDVVVVNDGSTDDTLERLREAFALEPVELFYRRTYDAKPVRTIYRSRTNPNLLVVDKVNGGKADSLNCGLNFARYRYVCGVDGDTILARRSLLDGMRLVLTDPGRVIGVTGHIAISGKPEASLNEDGAPCRLDPRPLLAFQHLAYLRSFFNNRLRWTRQNMLLHAVVAVQIWRRDVHEEVGGFSTDFTCEDIELTFRLHERFRREGRDYEILSLADTVGVTEGPDRIRSLISQRERWQRVIMETVVHYRRMAFNPRYGTVGLLGVPFFVLTEVVAPFFELASL